MIDRVDEDKSGEIEFDEFLNIIYELSNFEGNEGKVETAMNSTT